MCEFSLFPSFSIDLIWISIAKKVSTKKFLKLQQCIFLYSLMFCLVVLPLPPETKPICCFFRTVSPFLYTFLFFSVSLFFFPYFSFFPSFLLSFPPDQYAPLLHSSLCIWSACSFSIFSSFWPKYFYVFTIFFYFNTI